MAGGYHNMRKVQRNRKVENFCLSAKAAIIQGLQESYDPRAQSSTGPCFLILSLPSVHCQELQKPMLEEVLAYTAFLSSIKDSDSNSMIYGQMWYNR